MTDRPDTQPVSPPAETAEPNAPAKHCGHMTPMVRGQVNEWQSGIRACAPGDGAEFIATAARRDVVLCVRRREAEQHLRLSPAQARRIASRLAKLADVVEASMDARKDAR
jgi:hypothetical protein